MTDLYFSGDYKKKLRENGDFTRDIAVLNGFEDHYVFVYGTLKRGHKRHSILASSRSNRFCGVGVTLGKTYDLLIANPENIPVLMENTTKERLLKTKGELWLVDTETLIKIDHVESNGYIYERVPRRIVVGKEYVIAWIYLGMPKFWRDKDLKDSPKFSSGSDSEPKHYFHFYNEGISQRLMSKPIGFTADVH